MATISGAGLVAAVMVLTASGHVIKTTQFELTTIDAWPGHGSVAAHSTITGRGQSLYVGKGTVVAVSTLTGRLTEVTTFFGTGSVAATSSITGAGTAISGGKGTLAGQSVFSATGDITIKGGAGRVTSVATLSASGTVLFQGRGAINAVSHFSAVGDGYTIANKELYVKDNGEWVKIFPPAGVTTEWDGGTW